jgi:hypothetical protein
MTMVRGIPCPANTLRDKLRHTWLENQIFFYNSDDVVSFWKDGDWSHTINLVYGEYIQQAIELADNLIDGFSPAQLVDELSLFRSLTEETRNKIKKAIHETYLATTNISSLEEPLRKAAIGMQTEIINLQILWGLPHVIDNERALRQCWERIGSKGKPLHCLLGKLPKGVVLP